MVIRLVPLISLGVVAVGVAVPTGQHASRQASTDEVGQMFDKNCGTCHVRPDARFKTDRAWIERILGTT